MKKKLIPVLQLVLLLFPCCAQPAEEKELINVFRLRDSQPPKLISVVPVDEYSIRVLFDKPVSAVESSFYPNLTVNEDFSILVKFQNEMDADKEYTIEGIVKDNAKNTTYFSAKIWGYNPNPADLLINEFTTKSSSKQCDKTELYVTKGGLVSGFTLYDGIPDDYKAKVSLGSLEVKKGDYIVVWWCSELDETVKVHPSDNVWNICSKTTTNPSENNGIQVVTKSPSQGAETADCVIYSSFESSQYSGFGTKEVYQRVQKALDKQWWTGPAVSSQSSTGTRSMFRYPGSFDSNTCNEWKICPTGKSTFGSENSAETF